MNQYLMVHDIIYEDTKSWDETTMRSNLCHEDAEKVLQIPLLDSIKQDSFVLVAGYHLLFSK